MTKRHVQRAGQGQRGRGARGVGRARGVGQAREVGQAHEGRCLHGPTGCGARPNYADSGLTGSFGRGFSAPIIPHSFSVFPDTHQDLGMSELESVAEAIWSTGSICYVTLEVSILGSGRSRVSFSRAVNGRLEDNSSGLPQHQSGVSSLCFIEWSDLLWFFAYKSHSQVFL